MLIVMATPAIAYSPKFPMIKRTPMAAKIHAKSQMQYFGWSQKTQWACLNQLWQNESGWRPNAKNKTPVRVLKGNRWVKVYAGGIPQILALKPSTPVYEQIRRGMVYIKGRYGSPCKALSFWNRHYWY